jgi:hypothetical protein
MGSKGGGRLQIDVAKTGPPPGREARMYARDVLTVKPSSRFPPTPAIDLRSLHERQRPGHRFERPALGRNAPPRFDDGGCDHQCGSEQIAGENAGP